MDDTEVIARIDSLVEEEHALARDIEGRSSTPDDKARLRELVETGELRELVELQRAIRPELIGLAQQLGLRTSRMIEIAETLGVSTADEFEEAARGGALLATRPRRGCCRLSTVRGLGGR